MATYLQAGLNQTRQRTGIEVLARRNRKGKNIAPAAQIEDPAYCVPGRQPSDWRVTRVKDFIDQQNGQLGTSLDQMCRELDTGVSAGHLSRLFQKEMGLGVREYSRRLRMRAAAHKLSTTALPIKHIAADLGYRGPADFFRQFKNEFRVTPCEFRALQRRGQQW